MNCCGINSAVTREFKIVLYGAQSKRLKFDLTKEIHANKFWAHRTKSFVRWIYPAPYLILISAPWA